jgi:cytochrome c biogenesis protein CcdA
VQGVWHVRDAACCCLMVERSVAGRNGVTAFEYLESDRTMTNHKQGAVLGVMFTIVGIGLWFFLFLELLSENTMNALIVTVALVVMLVGLLITRKG